MTARTVPHQDNDCQFATSLLSTILMSLVCNERKKIFGFTTHPQLYDIGHSVTDNRDERKLAVSPSCFLFPINRKGSFIYTTSHQESAYQNLCYTSCEILTATKNSCVSTMGGRCTTQLRPACIYVRDKTKILNVNTRT